DGAWTTIGTANIDRLSLTGNYEINVEIYDDDLAREMERIFARDLDSCRQLTLAEWQRRHVVARFSEAVLRPMRPLLWGSGRNAAPQHRVWVCTLWPAHTHTMSWPSSGACRDGSTRDGDLTTVLVRWSVAAGADVLVEDLRR